MDTGEKRRRRRGVEVTSSWAGTVVDVRVLDGQPGRRRVVVGDGRAAVPLPLGPGGSELGAELVSLDGALVRLRAPAGAAVELCGVEWSPGSRLGPYRTGGEAEGGTACSLPRDEPWTATLRIGDAVFRVETLAQPARPRRGGAFDKRVKMAVALSLALQAALLAFAFLAPPPTSVIGGLCFDDPPALRVLLEPGPPPELPAPQATAPAQRPREPAPRAIVVGDERPGVRRCPEADPELALGALLGRSAVEPSWRTPAARSRPVACRAPYPGMPETTRPDPWIAGPTP